MAPPPFKVVGDLPKPLTVKETAKTLRVSPEKLQATLAALRLVLRDDESPRPRRKALSAARPSHRAKAAKTQTTAKAAAATSRSGRKAAKTATRSRG